jgi:hypothetical protein
MNSSFIHSNQLGDAGGKKKATHQDSEKEANKYVNPDIPGKVKAVFGGVLLAGIILATQITNND